MLTESVQIEIVTVVQRGGFAIDVVPVVADLILLVERRIVRTQEPEILNLNGQIKIKKPVFAYRVFAFKPIWSLALF